MNEEMSTITIPAGTCGNRGDVVFTSSFPITSELLRDIAAHIAVCEALPDHEAEEK